MADMNSPEVEKSVSESLSEIQDRDPEVDIDESDFEDLREEVSSLKKDANTEKIENRIEGLEERINELESRLDSAQVEEKVDRTHFEDRISELEEKVESPDETVEKRLRDLEAEEKVDRSELEEKISEVREKVENELGDELDRLESETADNSEVGSLWATTEMLEDRIENVQEASASQDKLEKETGKFKSKVQSVENEFENMRASINALQEEDTVTEEGLQGSIEDMRRELNQKVSDVREEVSSDYATSKEVSSLWDALKSLEDRVNTIESRTDEFSETEDTVTYLEHKVDKIQDVSALKQRVDDLEDVVNGMDEQMVGAEQYKDLMKDVKQLSDLTRKVAERNQ